MDVRGLEVTYNGHNDWRIMFVSRDETKVKLSRKISDAKGYDHKWVKVSTIGGLECMMRA